jgi:hypothetical protein
MAIQPIDLQTLFTQMDKVGKTVALQKEGVALQQSIQSIQIQKRTEANIQSVNEAQDTGEGTERINDQNTRKKQQEEAGAEEEKASVDNGEPEDEGEIPVIRDPALGRNIDFSG